MKYFLSIFVIFLSSSVSFCQQTEIGWAIRVGDDISNIDDIFVDATIDQEDNVILCGYNSSNGYLTKIDRQGQVVWSVLLSDNPVSIKVDETNNIYVVVGYKIEKYGQDADLLWSRNIGVKIIDLEFKNDYLYIVGWFSGTYDFGGTPPNVLTAAGVNDGFVLKYDKDGNLIWAINSGIAENDYASKLAVNSVDEIVVCGSVDKEFYDPDFNYWETYPCFLSYEVSQSGGNPIVKNINSTNFANWSVCDLEYDVNDSLYLSYCGFDDETSVKGYDISLIYYGARFADLLFGNLGSFYVSGWSDRDEIFKDVFNHNFNIQTNNRLAFLTKYSSEKILDWVLGLESDKYGIRYKVSNLADSYGNVYLVGDYLNYLYAFSNDYSQDVLNSSKGADIFLVKIIDKTNLGIVDSKHSSTPTVFPNPVNDILSIDFGKKQKDAQVQIYNPYGVLVYSDIVKKMSSFTIHFNYPKGIYFLKIHTEKGTWIEKIVKQ